MTAHFQAGGGRLTASVLSIKNTALTAEGAIKPSWDFARTFLRFRGSSMQLAAKLGAKVLRVQGDVVINPEVKDLLLRAGFKEVPDSPSTFYKDFPVE